MFKKIIYKIIGFSLLILFGLDSTTFLEGLDENQETENNSIQKQSWWDYICLHKFEILIGCGVVILIGIPIYFTFNSVENPPINICMCIPPSLNPEIESILLNLKLILNSNIIYHNILIILTDHCNSTNLNFFELLITINLLNDLMLDENITSETKLLIKDLIKELKKI